MARMCGCSGQCMDKSYCPAMPRFDLADESKPEPVSKRPPPPRVPCSDCNEGVQMSGRKAIPCTTCKGTGKVSSFNEKAQKPKVSEGEMKAAAQAWEALRREDGYKYGGARPPLPDGSIKVILEAAAAERRKAQPPPPKPLQKAAHDHNVIDCVRCNIIYNKGYIAGLEDAIK